jgi:hypothetical protein
MSPGSWCERAQGKESDVVSVQLPLFIVNLAAGTQGVIVSDPEPRCVVAARSLFIEKVVLLLIAQRVDPELDGEAPYDVVDAGYGDAIFSGKFCADSVAIGRWCFAVGDGREFTDAP